MKEDLIETLTSLVFEGKMNNLILAFARASTRDVENEFRKKLDELKKVTPTLLGISQFFTLDKTSKIEEVFI